MFQNIDGIAKNPSKSKTINALKSLKIKSILSEVLRVNNIVIYILTILISSNSIVFEHVPLGVSVVAAAISANIPLIGVLIAAIIGTIIGHGMVSGFTLVAICLILFIISSILKPKVAVADKNEGMKLGSRLILSSMLILILREASKTGFMPALFFAFVDSAMVYAFYKVFVNGMAVIRDIGDKKVFTIEEYMSLVAIIIAAFSVGYSRLAGFGNITIIIQSIVICSLLMWIALKNRTVVSVLASIVAGIILVSVNVGYVIYIPVMMAAGFIGSGLNHFTRNKWTKKIYTAFGFIIGSLAASYLLKVNIQLFNFDYMFNMISCIIGFVILLIVPSNANIKLEDLVGSVKLISDFKDNRLKPSILRNSSDLAKTKKIIINKDSPEDNSKKKDSNNDEDIMVDSVSDLDELFDVIVDIPEEDYKIIDETKLEREKQETLKNNYIQDVLDNIEELKDNILFEQLSEDERIVADCYDILNQDNIIANQDFVKILENYNNYVFLNDETVKQDLEEIIIVLNRTYSDFKLKSNK